jgi:hypothetical protein
MRHLPLYGNYQNLHLINKMKLLLHFLLIFFSFCSLLFLVGCTSDKKERIILLIKNFSKNTTVVSAEAQFLTPYNTGDIKRKCNCGDSAWIFNLEQENSVGYLVNTTDTINLYCMSLDGLILTKRYMQHGIDSIYDPVITHNNFFIGQKLDYMSLSDMDSVIQQTMKNVTGIHYITLDGKDKFISFKNATLEYQYFFDLTEVQKGDSLYYVRMEKPQNVLPSPF